MPDEKCKPAIPAWQRAHQKAVPEDSNDVDTKTGQIASSTSEETSTAGNDVATPAEPASASVDKDSIPANTDASLNTSDFESFKRTQGQQDAQTQQSPQPQKLSAPPIITYPEFLVDAHKPPPLITPGRILDTAYIVGGLTALIYGASKYLVSPMSASLSDARHDFAVHSQSKIDEVNERLSKIVTRVPGAKTSTAGAEDGADVDGTESETSDPTELYHRDMGTQTSPLPSRRSSLSRTPKEAEKKKDPVAYATNNLAIMKSHLNEMLERTESLETPNKARQGKLNDLRNYLDTMMYASPGANIWSATDDADKLKDKKASEDVIEELKKEIRGVKGVLLSAKRFPGVAAKVGA